MYSIINLSSGFCVIFCAVPAICFLIGSCWLFISFAKDATNDLSLLINVEKPRRNYAELGKRFCDIVRAYSDVKELSMTWSRVARTKYIISILMQGCRRFQHSLWIQNVSRFCVDSFGHLHCFHCIYGTISWVYQMILYAMIDVLTTQISSGLKSYIFNQFFLHIVQFKSRSIVQIQHWWFYRCFWSFGH